MTRQTIWVMIALIPLALSLGGCAGTLKLNLVGTPKQNLDADSTARSVVVRVYYLKAVTRFKDADFQELYRADTTILGTDIIGSREEYTVYPDSQVTLICPLKRKGNIAYVGLFAAYRDYEPLQWRKWLAVKSMKKATIITLTRSGIEIGRTK